MWWWWVSKCVLCGVNIINEGVVVCGLVLLLVLWWF